MPDLNVEPLEVSNAVEQYVRSELADAAQYDNRTPLDESGVWSLHVLAATIYAMGWREGRRVGESNAEQAGRRREDALRAQHERGVTG